ncbi:hypothetical protein Nmel_002226 [Mimus melanotis]
MAVCRARTEVFPTPNFSRWLLCAVETVLHGGCPPTRIGWVKLVTSVKCQSFKHKTYAFQPLKIINSASSAFLNVESAEILKDLDDYYEKFKRETDAVQKRRMLHCIQRALIRSQELGDEKIQIVSQMVELVENRTRQVDSHVELFETCQETNDTTGNSGKASQDKSKNETIAQAEKPNNKRSRRQRNNENRENASNNHDHDDITSGTPKEKKAKTSKKKKRSKAKAEREASPPDLPIDPNEPTYCLCNQVSYGEMIGCDNDECPIEWFHFSCVGLNHKPKGKWYCPKCRGENEKTMDKALEKSKKERAYNR